MNFRSMLESIFRHAVQSVNPYNAVKKNLELYSEIWKRGASIIGFGKASGEMGKACEDVLGECLTGGYLITKYGHSVKLHRLPLLEAGHPLPDENSLKRTKELICFLDDIKTDENLICLISGGGSALLCQPCEGISLADKAKTTEMLLNAGADITELNTVRKHISAVKGGRLLGYIRGRKILSLILSDVIGDRLDVIASGPTYPDETTFLKAIEVLQKYDLIERIPNSVRIYLEKGIAGIAPETLKMKDFNSRNVVNLLIGNLSIAKSHAAEKAKELGLIPILPAGFITGEAKKAGYRLAVECKKRLENKQNKPLCLITGGETTVRVVGNGRGGRNMELALSFAMEISGMKNIAMLSAGTDGNDGPTDAAGAVVDGNTIKRGRASGMDPEEYLRVNNTYHYFKKEGGILITGPTGTNVMDIQIIICN